MAALPRRTVITGLGLLNALGSSTSAVWEAFRQGKSGIGPVRTFDASGLPVRFAGEISDFDAKKFIPKEEKDARKQLRIMARTIQLAVAAGYLAMSDGKVNHKQLVPERFGLEFGSGLISMELEDLGDAAQASLNGKPEHVDMKRWGRDGLPTIQPLWMLKYLPNMPACHLSINFDARGPNNSITESDVASLLALGEAHRILQRNAADFFLVGGAESKINPLSMVRLCLFEPLSHNNDDPAHACRPFDRRRDGIVLGEGAAVYAVEDLEHARRRNARIYAEVVGFGSAFDARRSGNGLARAMRAALKDAKVQPADIDHINAHGLSTIDSDAWEARAIHDVFGGCKPAVPVLAAKSCLGNIGAGGGLSELALSILGLHHDEVPGTLNYDEPDPACPVHVHTGAARKPRTPYVLKVGFTQMGQCAAAIVRKYTE